jgi:hypothetical protein
MTRLPVISIAIPVENSTKLSWGNPAEFVYKFKKDVVIETGDKVMHW